MKSKEFIEFLDKSRDEIYQNQDSILKKYDDFLAMNGIYRGYDIVTFRKKIKGRTELCEGMLELYSKAKLDNESISILEDLYAVGYDKDKLVELILDAFNSGKQSTHLWECGDLLYRIKNYKYMPQYIGIISNESLKEARQMVILLVGKSKGEDVIPTLISLVSDETVMGHTLDALSHFKSEEIKEIMLQYKEYNVRWIRKIVEKYLKRYEETMNAKI